MILSDPLTFLSLPVTHLLGSTKTGACNCLRVTCINDRDKNNLKNGFHGKMRGIEGGHVGFECSARAKRTPIIAIKHSNNRSTRSSICLYSVIRRDCGKNKQRNTHKSSRVDGCTKSNRSL